MKVHLEIEATPQEFRTFFGLPDIEKLQKEMIQKIRDMIGKGELNFDPMNFMKPFFPENLQTLDAYQKNLWKSMLPFSQNNPDGNKEPKE